MVILKNSFYFLLSLIFFLNVAYAQEFNYGLSFGLGKTSGIFSEERYNNSSDSEINYNLMASLYLPSNSNFRVQTGLKYIKLGYNVDVDIRTIIGPSPINYTTTFSFLALPINVNYTLPFLSNVYFSGGLEAAYLMSASSKVLYNDNSSSNRDISDQYKDLNFFFAFGIGITVPFNDITLFIHPEYTRSIKALTESTSFGSASHLESILINVGFRF